MARPERFELPTTKFVAWYSIQLSYGRAVKLVCPDSAAEAMGAEARSGIIQIGRGGVNTFFKISSLSTWRSAIRMITRSRRLDVHLRHLESTMALGPLPCRQGRVCRLSRAAGWQDRPAWAILRRPAAEGSAAPNRRSTAWTSPPARLAVVRP